MNEFDQAKACFNFTVGNPDRKEFYSPHYPKKYPNNTDCIKQIEAPYGYYVVLDFRDNFHLEESTNCEYDYLEILDGPYGYSNLLGRYCGATYPPLTQSSGRYLWLKFHSDDSIEYLGFKAVYQFFPLEDFHRPPPEECIFHKSGSDGFISNSDISQSMLNYSLNWNVSLDCTWAIEVYPTWKMYLTFQKYQLAHPNNCDLNYIDIYGESLSVDARLDRFCGTATEPQRSEKNILHVRYFAQSQALDGIFRILFTGFRESEECDKIKEFDCGDGTCVDQALKCNGHFNCKYRYDEEDTICSVGSTASVVLSSEHMIIILVVFFALVLGMCLSVSISCYNKIKERKEEEQELRLRRSKDVSIETGLDQKVSGLEKDLGSMKTVHNTNVTVEYRNNGGGVAQEENEGCYVPEIDLSTYDEYPNGGSSVARAADHCPRSPPTRQAAVTILPDGSQHHPFCSHHQRGSPPLPPPPPPPHLRKPREEVDPLECFVLTDNHCPKHNRLTTIGVQPELTETVVELYPDSPGGCRHRYDHLT
ncbi:neuropilin and tolloid-like protein 2 [Tachypleus tridentatus]|uniref:neuropilin and tolloid-like protein 2 n=1 Tax=Tachypleus tridentatus TaxID=6853 RepID=UPI003FD4B659